MEAPLRYLTWILALSLSACSHTEPRYRDPAGQPAELQVAPAEVEHRLVLVGDAGHEQAGRHLISALMDFVGGPLLARTTLVYLGDNTHGRGPDLLAGEPASRVLNAQLRVGQDSAGVLFLGGEEDWDGGSGFARGLAKATLEARYVESPRRRPSGRFLPSPPCPGPVSVERPGVKVVALDSQWWFQDPQERTHWARTLDCPHADPDEVLDALKRELRCEGPGPCPPRVVLAHHPLASVGERGGIFPWHEYLICFDWVPLFPVCTPYVLARRLGASSQDLTSKAYAGYVAALREAMKDDPPLAFVAAHDHSLQVIDGQVAKHLLVSGAGSRVTWVGSRSAARFAQAERGVLVLDFLRDGRVALRAYSLRKRPRESDAEQVQLIYGEWLAR